MPDEEPLPLEPELSPEPDFELELELSPPPSLEPLLGVPLVWEPEPELGVGLEEPLGATAVLGDCGTVGCGWGAGAGD